MSLPSEFIGLTGFAGCGKDTAAEILSQFYHFKRFALADKVKQVVEVAFGISTHVANHPQLKNIPDSYWEMSPRAAAQLVGTECFRRVFGQDIWIQVLERQLHSTLQKRVVVSDIRFQNEAEWILKNNGILVHLTRDGADGKVGISNHASEAGVDFAALHLNQDYDRRIFYIENNSTKKYLKSKLDSIVIEAFKLSIKPEIKEQ